ncbi:MAG: hypothetical protein JNL83_18535 [Myxococcales bacterium]|nr:hypothetical protein [Myxococcales bacterium]
MGRAARVREAMILVVALTACGDGSTERPVTFGGDRPVTIGAPATLTDGKQYPLVVVLHGYSANGFVQEAYFGMNALPDRDEALVLAPDGTVDSSGKQFWNADAECCDFDGKNPDDVGYIGGLIDDVLDTWPVDPKKVFVIGHSNGGFMSYRMACERADVIAAIAPLAGLASSMPAGCNPSKPVNVLHMHGTVDQTVPYGPTAAVGQIGAVGSVSQWAQKNGCGTTRTAAGDLDLETSQAGAETHTFKTDGCPVGGSVDLWTMEGVGHIPSLNSSFNSTVMQWFTEHSRS